MHNSSLLGVTFHAIGAFFASSCYTPQKLTKKWNWEVYWVTQATFAWLVFPIAIAFLTIPDYLSVLEKCPTDVMLRSFLYGLVYGVGGLMFGLGIRYIGFSLNYAIAIGISAVLGTIAPLIWHPNNGFVWEFGKKFNNVYGLIILGGFVIAVLGIITCGWAGALRERRSGGQPSRFSFKIGVPLAAMSGIFSVLFYYAMLSGGPLEELARNSEAIDLLKKNAIYPFSNGGAWIASLFFCGYLIWRNRSAGQFIKLPSGEEESESPSSDQPILYDAESESPSPYHPTFYYAKSESPFSGRLIFYYAMGILSGAFWYFQFFFYGMGESCMGKDFAFIGWILHMSLLILFSNIYGYLFKEWEGADRLPKRVLHIGMAAIIIATLVIGYGSHLGKENSERKKQDNQQASHIEMNVSA